MNQRNNIEAEGQELILRNEAGDMAIIPAKYRYEALGMMSEGCHQCIDAMVDTLPVMEDYAADGTILPYQYLNGGPGGPTLGTIISNINKLPASVNPIGIINAVNPMNLVEHQLYKNIRPKGYTTTDQKETNYFGASPTQASPVRAIQALFREEEGRKWMENDAARGDAYAQSRLDFFAKYMGKPQRWNTLYPSPFKPSSAINQRTTYYRAPAWEEREIEDYILGNFNKSDNGSLSNDLKQGEPFPGSEQFGAMKPKSKVVKEGAENLGHYMVSTGEDAGGKYFSYYDKWDLNPQIIGNPFEVYGRIYYKLDENGNPYRVWPQQYGTLQNPDDRYYGEDGTTPSEEYINQFYNIK